MQLINLQESAADAVERARALETGNILFFPQTPFEIPAADKELLLSMRLADGSFHKNIAYRPNQDRISGLADAGPAVQDQVAGALRRYSQRAIDFLGELLPHYKDKWRLDFASFRPLEEEGRSLSWKKRNDLLHIDAFPTRPTNGDLILRLFTNIHPSKMRVWLTGDPFGPLAERYAPAAGLQRISGHASSPGHRGRRTVKRLFRQLGLPVADRSPYDEFMLGFHDFLKSNSDYQQNCPKYRLEFPPNSTWIVFTDVVPHSVLSGQFALEQTLVISRDTLVSPAHAPVAILERLAGTRLTN